MIWKKVCKLCGKSFETDKLSQKICPDIHYRSCEICGKKFVITMPSNSQLCCSKECTVKKRQNTMKERYGVAHALQNPELRKKAEQTSIERFGVAHAAQSEEIKEKEKKIFQEKYGVDHPFLMSDFWDKYKQTSLDRYGYEYPMQADWFKEKLKNTCQDKYGASYLFQSEIIKEKTREACMEKYGVPYPCMTENCVEANNGEVISKINKTVADKIESLGFKCELDKIHINRFSYDIHIINTNILLEVDPTYTHNVFGNHWGPSRLDENYHLNKTRLAVENGYRCIHIFDWDNLDNMLKLLQSKETIYARKCKIKYIEPSVATRFENDYHIQGSCRGQKICLGLFYDDKLIQVMTFGKPRYNKKYQWELLRLCTNSNYKVVGGAQRLFKHFIQENKPESIISYCDLAKFSGEVYSKLGFVLSHTTAPNKIWSKADKYVTNNLLLARGYDQLFEGSYGKGTSNEKLMLENGWLPVYDCGQDVYVWNNLLCI